MPTTRSKSIDGVRITDLTQVMTALELYKAASGSYPIVLENDSVSRWNHLKFNISHPTFLKDSSFMGNPPDDYCYKSNKMRQYDYKSSPDGFTYVLKANLFNRRHVALDNERIIDLDGNVFGIWCGESGWEIEYCRGPKGY